MIYLLKYEKEMNKSSRALYLEAYNNQKQSEISKRKSLSISIF